MLEELDCFERPPLIIASKFENFDLPLALIDSGAKIDESKVDIDRVLFAVICIRNAKAVDKLLSARANYLPQKYYGRSTDLIGKKFDGLNSMMILQCARGFCISSVEGRDFH